MKRFIKTIAIVCIYLGAFGQIPLNKKAVTAGQLPAGMQPVDRAHVAALKHQANPQAGGRLVQQIILDYDAVDEIATVDSGGVYDRFIWSLNSRFRTIDTTVFGLHWAVVVYDTLYDAANLVAFPYSSTAVKIDSIQVFVTHENVTGTPDTIQVSVYKYEGAAGLRVNSIGTGQNQEQIINAVLYDTLIITTTSLTPGANMLGVLSIVPDLQLGMGEKFLVGVHFYGDTANTFTVLAGYGERCGGACANGQGAYTSVFELNSLWRLIVWAGTTNLTGINSVAYNCDGDQIIGETEECEEFTIQNFAFTTFVTIDPALTSTISGASSICPGETVTLSVNPVGGTPPYNVSWSPTTGLTAPFSPTTNATPTTTTTYTATIIDAEPDTITKTVTVTVNSITVNAGADVNISCGQTANLTATVSGTVTGATFQWNNGVNTLNNPNVGAGTYSITATNSFGCSSTDAVVVAIPGVSQVLSFNTGLPNNIGCRNVAIQFTNTSSTLANWNWSWNFGDGSGNISFAQNPTYTYTQNGTYTVTLSADSAGCSVQDATKVVTIQTCTGIADSYLSQLIDVYPNPTSGLFTISFREVGSKAAVVNIYDIRGALITEQPVTVNGSDSQKSFTLSKAADGIYFVKIQMGDEVLMKKLILSR